MHGCVSRQGRQADDWHRKQDPRAPRGMRQRGNWAFAAGRAPQNTAHGQSKSDGGARKKWRSGPPKTAAHPAGFESEEVEDADPLAAEELDAGLDDGEALAGLRAEGPSSGGGKLERHNFHPVRPSARHVVCCARVQARGRGG